MTDHPDHHRPRTRTVTVLATLFVVLAALYVWSFARGRVATRLRNAAPAPSVAPVRDAAPG